MQKVKYDIRVEAEDLSPVKKKLSITVPADAVKEEFNAVYKSLRSSAAVAGFRKGSIPINIIKAKFGGQIREDVTSKLIEMSYSHALFEKKLAPVENPQIDITKTKLDEAKEFSYSVTVEVTPQVEINDYKGMDIKREAVEVTDKDMEDGLKNLRESRAQFKEVDRASKEGDLLTADLVGAMNGEEIKGSKVENYPFLIGDKTLLPGLEEVIKGASKGEVKEAKVTFPENYSDKNLASKDAVFTIKVKAVKERVVPALDDEFAKDLECDNLEVLKTRLKEDLMKVKEEKEKERVKNVILDKLIEKYPFEVPEALVNRYLGMILQQVSDNMKQGIIAPEDKGLTLDQLRAKYRDSAIRHVKEDIVLDSLSAKENVQITEEEYEVAIKRLAEIRQVSYQQLTERIMREGATEVIKDGLKHEKVFDIIIAALKAA
jgi:trigger factor